MPFSPASNPDLAAELMFKGISSAGQGLAQGLSGAIDRYKQTSDERKAYLGMAKAMNAAGELPDVTLEQLQNQDTHTLKGFIDGTKFVQVLKDQRAQADLRQSQAGYFNRRLMEEGPKSDFSQALFKNLADVTQPPAPLNDAAAASYQAKPVTQGQFLQAVTAASAKSGYAPKPDDIDGFMRAMQSLSPDASGPPQYSEDPVSGARSVTYGKSIQPSGYNPARNTATVQEAVDEEGNPTGVFMRPNPKGGPAQILKMPAKDFSLTPAIDKATKKPIPGAYIDGTGKVHNFLNPQTRAELELFGAGGAAASAPAKAAEPPPDAATEIETLNQLADMKKAKVGRVSIDTAGNVKASHGLYGFRGQPIDEAIAEHTGRLRRAPAPGAPQGSAAPAANPNDPLGILWR